MNITIQNDKLLLVVDSLGAQMKQLRGADGTEYLWRGDSKYWKGSAPVLFPYVGRMWNSAYTLYGVQHSMNIHGFAAASEFQVEEQGQDYMLLKLRDNEQTMAQYPFRFEFRVSFKLCGNTLETKYSVVNTDDKQMHFGLGGHPGFNVPFGGEEAFEDFYLRFGGKCLPDRVGFSPECFVNGEDRQYPLEDGQIIRLSHDMFDDDAIVLKNMWPSVSLCSGKTDRCITVSYPQMPYLGLWHMPKTDAPYICIEPWTSLPSRHGVVEELASRSDMIHLAPGESYDNVWYIGITE